LSLLGAGQFQYLGIPNKVRILAPIHKLHLWLKGDNSKCSYGVQVSDAGGWNLESAVCRPPRSCSAPYTGGRMLMDVLANVATDAVKELRMTRKGLSSWEVRHAS
jgi:hypothetical protein